MFVARNYLQGADLDQGFLLPVDMRDWLPQDHPVWFFSDVVASLDLAQFEAKNRRGGVGRAGYDPRRLLAVMLFGYAFGQRSSRTLERLCQQDVAFRILAGGLSPDHTTIARFRALHETAVEGVFAQVLVLCAQVGLVNLDTVSIDGTKIAASASPLVNKDSAGLEKELELARKHARKALADAAATDAAEDDQYGEGRGDQLPDDLIDQDSRVRRVQELQDLLNVEENKAEARREAEREAGRKYLAARADPDGPRNLGAPPIGVDPVEAAKASLERTTARVTRDRENRLAAASREPGPSRARKIVPVEKFCRVKAAAARVVAAQEQAERDKLDPPKPTKRERRAAKKVRINTTDPESRNMTSAKGWVQGFNTQIAVSEDQIVIAVNVVNTPVDVHQFEPLMNKSEAVAQALETHRPEGVDGQIGVVLADAGYASAHNLTAPGPDRLIATGRLHKLPKGEPVKPPPPGAGPIPRMTHRLRTKEGRETYKRRGTTVEPVNGHLKTIVGLRQMSRRGLAAAQAEVTLAATALNLSKLLRKGIQPA